MCQAGVLLFQKNQTIITSCVMCALPLKVTDFYGLRMEADRVGGTVDRLTIKPLKNHPRLNCGMVFYAHFSCYPTNILYNRLNKTNVKNTAKN